VVTAVNAIGESTASTQVSALPAAPVVNSVPAAPTGVTATVGNAQTTLAWTAVSGATSYNIYYATTTGVTPANGTKITGATNPYTKTQLTNGTTYYYVVTAVNANGESTASTQVSKTPTTPPYISAQVTTFVSGVDPFGVLHSVSVCTDNTCQTPILNATVTLNGSTLTYSPSDKQYNGNIAIAAGSTVTFSATIGSNTYSATGTQFTTLPTITAPTSNATWQASSANTINWTSGAPTSGATYFVAIADSTGNGVYPGPGAPLPVPIGTTSTIIPSNSLKAGNYNLVVGIANASSVSAVPNIAIANATSDSGLMLIGASTAVPITVH
jgi:hypothetical protein